MSMRLASRRQRCTYRYAESSFLVVLLLSVTLASVSCFSNQLFVPIAHHDPFSRITRLTSATTQRRTTANNEQPQQQQTHPHLGNTQLYHSNRNEQAWYVDSELSRSVRPSIHSHVKENDNDNEDDTVSAEPKNAFNDNARFILTVSASRPGGNVRHCMSYAVDGDGDVDQEQEQERVEVVMLNVKDIEALVGKGTLEKLLSGDTNDKSCLKDMELVWVGERREHQYWTLMLPPTWIPNNINKDQSQDGNDKTEFALLQGVAQTIPTNHRLEFIPLREFGDSILHPDQAAIHATANALLEFHTSHLYCSVCGSPTSSHNVGSSRLCSNNVKLGGTCVARSIYPRIDVASIMLITSPCEQYALLGRKDFWPQGRYSTLAGFLEVGETIEECCMRETYEEAGVVVDPESVEFVQSAPWPFPRSLMVGFRGRAVMGGSTGDVPDIDFDEKEMEDVRWFSKDYVRKHLEGGSTALLYEPRDEEKEFHLPGKASLARRLVTAWVEED